MRRRILAALALALAATSACRSVDLPTGAEASADDTRRIAIEAVLDDFHLAASQADGARYFAHMTGDAVFLGTDATERWSRAAFHAYATPYFSKGTGWTYTSTERHVSLSPSGDAAWFDERLWNDKYGETRGSGALVFDGLAWRIAQYNLTIPVPNDLAGELVRKIRAAEDGAQ